ncbi:hypothetical protein ACIP93_02050 [Streptomyces sp. NPDC088745]|uniref:hypothetical protein n=1 Tax=Streptomyces sp. NPDC088745 TaxID=3365884 RepID=UPI00382166DD
MRTEIPARPFPRPLLTTALAATAAAVLLLTGCGTQRAASDDRAGGGSARQAGTATGAPAADRAKEKTPAGTPEAEARFLDLIGRALNACDPDAPTDEPLPPDEDTPTDKGAVPRPEDLPDREAATPRYGPDETPPPVPLPTDGPDGTEPPGPTTGLPPSRDEIPLRAVEKCEGDFHRQRITKAFRTSPPPEPASHPALHRVLTSLDYLPSGIHRMPDHGGSPRVRIDLRFMGGNLVLEVTAAPDGVRVDPFGASEQEELKVTDVLRKGAS